MQTHYRNILLLESKNFLDSFGSEFDAKSDLVLTFDFGVKKEIEEMGGDAHYIDHLCTTSEMQENNILASDFFKKWHYDQSGNDVFFEKGIPFGFTFRIEIWSEYLFYVRLRANLEKLKKIRYKKLFLGEKNGHIGKILLEIGIRNTIIDSIGNSGNNIYYFDIHKYMYDALHGKSIKNILIDKAFKLFFNLRWYIDVYLRPNHKLITVYAQIYHPTKEIVKRLKRDASLRVVTPSLFNDAGLKKYFGQQLIPIRGNKKSFNKQSELFMSAFREKKCTSLILQDGTNITEGAYRVIEHQIEPRISEVLQTLHSVILYAEKFPISLEIMIANIGLIQTVVDCFLKSKGVPSYLIINGLLGGDFCDESKYATYVNCYSESIKKYYYKGADNVFCLGDPRMDGYVNTSNKRSVNRVNPTITIGTSGFNNLDLNSYVAVEFEFMYDVLSAFEQLQAEGKTFNLIIKVRPNGYLKQYIAFVGEYFRDLKVEVIRDVLISEIFKKTDLYISIYSQTLFEASCLGIPVIYYKKDNEILDPPFDQKSELVTVDAIEKLKQAYIDFLSEHNRYNAFLDKRVMEKYVGYLDGNNLERNLEFINKLLPRE